MRVVTIEGFGGSDSGDYMYEGDAWLFRFRIDGPEEFFRSALPHFIRTFEIDSRQIYELTLYGEPSRGLYEARIYVSFEEPPSAAQVEKLRLPFDPETIAVDLCEDIFSQRLAKRLKIATPATRKRLTSLLRSKKWRSK